MISFKGNHNQAPERSIMKRRKDTKGRVLRKGESQRKDGVYMYRWTDLFGERKSVYAGTLEELRREEDAVQAELQSGIRRNNITLNDQIEWYLSTRGQLKSSTRENYIYYYHHTIENSFLGRMRVRDIRKSHILKFYADCKAKGYSNGTIAILQKILHPAFELALDDDVIGKNPSKGCLKDYSDFTEKKQALTLDEEKEFLSRVKESPRMNWLYPMYAIILITGMRISEVLGLTWNDVDMENRIIHINHQLLYRYIDGKVKLYVENSAKTESGVRDLPMNDEVYALFAKQKEQWFSFCGGKTGEIDGYSGFVFISKMNRQGLPIYANNVRKNLYRIVEQNEKRKVQLPPVSPHILRHTACTRMSESGMNLKVIQYMMGHHDMRTTVQVYDHADLERVSREYEKYDELRKEKSLAEKVAN